MPRSPRALALQALVALALAALAYVAATNASEKLARQGITAGFGFLGRSAGFDISQRLIPYAAATATYLDAFRVGLLNTLLVSGLAIGLATLIGFAVGIARLSPNWLVRTLAATYVETLRNLPLLLQLLVWYVAVRVALPEAQRPAAWGGAYLSQRGLVLPRPEFSGVAWLVPAAVLAGIVLSGAWARRRARRVEAGAAPGPVVGPALALVLGLPALAWIGLARAGHPVPVAWPAPGPYGPEGGLGILPEFAALLLGLSTYTAAFIAEIVRAGLNSVARGQGEAAAALGLSRAKTLALVTIPQAMRVIVPPLTSQYLNITKNSSLAVLIGYPDLVHVFMGTVLNQTNQAVEVVAITMAVYLTLSLGLAALMNAYNRRAAPGMR
ncbi:amino acid ABC transporter permease [Methylobacterium sp. Leaf94]|uniref:amino acid ABC transporter permease n=1 Tax=Methylobacterium sp. Leaf94 TaxID=1736250 RepID=UPI0006FA1A45|nr:ABC transporter permease subunit [Methylobacterium sp. Leaf94]KQU16292.1 amino acid ABC transporter permease [Methylobacterium sp. Leaf94]